MALCFPLKYRYKRSRQTLEGIDESTRFKERSQRSRIGILPEPGCPPDGGDPFPEGGQDTEKYHVAPLSDEFYDDIAQQEVDALPEPAPEDAPRPRDTPRVYVDALGRPYPIDDWGNIIRKTSRPFGVPPKLWNNASKTQRTQFREAFEWGSTPS